MFGRNRPPVQSTVRTVMGIRGELPKPRDPGQGLVWSSILDLVDHPGSTSDFVSVVDLERDRLRKHPWSIGGGGAAELKELVESHGGKLKSRIQEIGRTTHTGEDEFYVLPQAAARSRCWFDVVQLVVGEDVRDYEIAANDWVLFPYDNEGRPSAQPIGITRSPLLDLSDAPEAPPELWTDERGTRTLLVRILYVLLRALSRSSLNSFRLQGHAQSFCS